MRICNSIAACDEGNAVPIIHASCYAKDKRRWSTAEAHCWESRNGGRIKDVAEGAADELQL